MNIKRILWILGVSAVILGLGSCDRNPIIVPLSEGDNIYVNPNTHWPSSNTPAYIGDLSSYPLALQEVIRQRFPKQVSLETAGIIFVGAGEMSTNAKKLATAAGSGSFVVAPSVSQLMLLGANPKMAPVFRGRHGPALCLLQRLGCRPLLYDV